MSEVGAEASWGWPWGKAGSSEIPHPVVCHAIDTAAVAELLYDVLLGPGVRRDLESGLGPLGTVRSWVAVLCGLHDIGKCSPIFQAMRPDLVERYLDEGLRGLMDRLYPSSRDPEVRTLHGTLTAAHFRRCLKDWNAGADLRDAIAYGLGGHHGSLLSAHAVQRVPPQHHGGDGWHERRLDLVRSVARLWGLGDPAEAAWSAALLDVPGMVGLAGLASVSDWVASDPTNFPYREPPIDLPGYVEHARSQARHVVGDKLCWTRWTPPADTSYSGLFGEDPRPLQHAVEELTSDRNEPGVLVIEAPTGEGKTRAGFQAAARLVRRLGLSGMYFALPTKATAAQVHAELNSAATGLEIPHAPNLVHTGVPITSSCVDEDGDGAHDGHEWFTRKRGLLFPVGVGTIDQALQAVIRSRHVFVRVTGLSGKVLILDEVHDVDAHMTTLLRRLMWWCGRFAIPVVLMSATLPADQREHLVAHWCAGRHGLAPPKVVAPSEPGGQQVRWVGADAQPSSRPIGLSRTNAERSAVSLHHLDEDALTGWLQDQVASGGCALIIRNLVHDAEQTHEILSEEIKTWKHPPALIYLTGRTPNAERARTESWLREKFGPSSTQRPHAVVIGTQVLQHSLDLDFDVLVSDLAPINELIQRTGRIHRHTRAERAVSTPTFGLLQPPEGKDGPKFARGLHTVYHHALLLRTWNALWGRSELKLPAETSDLVHAVYSAPEQQQGSLRRRFDKAELSMSTQDNDDESRVRRFYLPPLRPSDSVRDLTYQPTVAARTRKDTPWKERP